MPETLNYVRIPSSTDMHGLYRLLSCVAAQPLPEEHYVYLEILHAKISAVEVSSKGYLFIKRDRKRVNENEGKTSLSKQSAVCWYRKRVTKNV
jgi:hypothetical protein